MAYITSAIKAVSRADDGSVLSVTIEFTGDAGEIPRRFEHSPGVGTKAEELLRAQQFCDEIKKRLNNKRSLADADGLVVDLVIGSAPTLTPQQIADAAAAASWRRKVEQYNTLAPMGTFPAGALATQVAALKTQVNDEFNAANGALRTLMAASL